MRRVLLISPSARPGGAERGLAGLARGLPALGYEPVVGLLEDGPLRGWLDQAGCETVLLPAGRMRYAHRTASTALRLARLARERGAEAIVSNLSKGHVYGGAAALAARLPAVWWQRDVAAGTRFERIAALLPAAAVVCVSDGAATAQRRMTPRARIEVIHSGVPVADVAAHRGGGAEIRRSNGWNGGPVVGVVGRLQPWKGQETFLRAAALLADSRPAARFAVVGGAILGWEGTYPERLEQLASELRLGERVLFTGHRDDAWDWLDALDVVVHCARDEPFGRVLVESMALGKPIVATAGPGPSTIVEHGVSGLLVPPGDPEALARTVQAVVDDPELRARLAAAGPGRAELFSEERMARRFAELLDSLLEPDAGAAP